MVARLAVLTLAVASLSFCTAEPEAVEAEPESDAESGDFVIRSAPTEEVEVAPLPLEQPAPAAVPPPAADESDE